MTSIERFERVTGLTDDRVARRAMRRKRLMPWAGAIALVVGSGFAGAIAALVREALR